MLLAYHPWPVMDQSQQFPQDMSYIQYSGNWMDNRDYLSQQQQQQQQSGQYVPMQMGINDLPYGDPAAIPRGSHHQLQPLMSTQWPGVQMPQGAYPASYSLQPGMMQGPPQAKYPHHTPTPRKTLTDADRRSMCLYAEENPTKKQTEIGGEFFWLLLFFLFSLPLLSSFSLLFFFLLLLSSSSFSFFFLVKS